MSDNVPRYPAIREPRPMLDSLTLSVRDLKQVVEMLVGVRDTRKGVRAVTDEDVAIALKMPVPLPKFVFQALPPAREWEGCQVYCTDIAAPKILHSDGFKWCRPTGAEALDPAGLPSAGGGDGGGDGGASGGGT